ncbi:hypothetical protein [Streptomyces sp. NPDC005907]|uniref:hypothetical protein n=1 Tax=Streptomyces sp. NPDC005907 TaxID=3154571 RepID=UPI00340B35CE
MISTVLRRVGLPLAVIGVLSGALSGCGPADPAGRKPPRTDDPREAAARTAVTRTLSEVRSRTREAGSARVDCSTARGNMVATRSKGVLGWSDSLSGTLTITYTGGSWATTMREMGNVSTPARFVSDTYYAKMSDRFATVSGRGRHWIKYGYDASANFTPAQSVELLLAAPDTREVGTEQVRGIRTTHYSGTVTVAALDAPRPGLTRAELADLAKWFTEAGVRKERVDVWVDAAGLLVKRSERGETPSGALVTTAYYADYGTRFATPEAPPADDTVDFADLVDPETP